MVESVSTQVAKMGQDLWSCSRWAVTGTPIGKHGVDDLRGLLHFLGADWSLIRAVSACAGRGFNGAEQLQRMKDLSRAMG